MEVFACTLRSRPHDVAALAECRYPSTMVRLGACVPVLAIALSLLAACTTSSGPTISAEQAQCETESLQGLYPRLSCTGLYTNTATHTLAPTSRAFTPGIVFWSDSAEKSRFIALPPGEKIDTTKMDEWVFPVGTRVWKEFKIDGKRTETRLYAKETAIQWRKTTYRWNAEETEAFRLDVGEKDVNGSTFEIPDTTQCDSCHDGAKDSLLGFEAVSLALPTAQGITLKMLVDEGLLTRAPGKTTLNIPDDGKGSVGALAFLHTNCGTSCHSQFSYSPLSYVGLDLRLYADALLNDEPINEMGIWKTTVGQPMRVASSGAPSTRIVKGAPGASALLYLAARRTADGSGQMPPIGTHEVDEVGVEALRQWIKALPP